jgi:DNA repair photolyase
MRTWSIEEIECKSLLQKCDAGFADYTINPYEGCGMGCSYCYVPVLRSYRGQESPAPWGRFVRVKKNAAEVLQREMKRTAPDARIVIGTATDPWQPLEKVYCVTRSVLEVLWYYSNPVSLTTRSPLLMRDISLLQEMENVRVNLSLPTFDDRVRRIFEPEATAIPGRLAALRALQTAGVRYCVFFCPILPGVMDNEIALHDYFRRASECGISELVCGTLRHLNVLRRDYERRIADYLKLGLSDGKRLAAPQLWTCIRRLAANYKIKIWGAGE